MSPLVLKGLTSVFFPPLFVQKELLRGVKKQRYSYANLSELPPCRVVVVAFSLFALLKCTFIGNDRSGKRLGLFGMFAPEKFGTFYAPAANVYGYGNLLLSSPFCTDTSPTPLEEVCCLGN